MTKNPTWRSRIVGHGEEAPDQLLANPKNWRTHPANQREALRGALDQVGWVQQVMVNRTTGHIVDGHARVEEALSRGEATVPVLYVELEPHEEDVVLATLDPIGALATRDDERLRMLLAEVEFDAEALREMTSDLLPRDPKVGLTDPDAVPEVADDGGIVRGDLFALGDHRLMCGDSTNAEDVARLLDGATIDATITDPPYAVNYDRSQAERGGSKKVHGAFHEGDTPSEVLGFMRLGVSDVLVMTFPVDRHFQSLAAALSDADMEFRKECVWVKDSFSFWPGAQYQQQHEPILICARRGKPVNSDVPANQSTVFSIPRPKAHELHPTAKPVELFEALVRFHAKATVFEPFNGSGTTLIASERTGRTCYAMEIAPQYVAVAIKRWEQFTGKQAVKL